jgi:hypothetical protein
MTLYVQTWTKDPQAKLPYTLDWAQWLAKLSGTATITSSTWSVPAGITKDSDTNTSLTTTVRLSGGTVDTDYVVTNHVVLSDGSEDERSILIQVRER